MGRPAILRKDFIVDEYQLLEARANGADTVLLIVAVLEVDRLDQLIHACRELEMEPLVEVHTQQNCYAAMQGHSAMKHCCSRMKARIAQQYGKNQRQLTAVVQETSRGN